MKLLASQTSLSGILALALVGVSTIEPILAKPSDQDVVVRDFSSINPSELAVSGPTTKKMQLSFKGIDLREPFTEEETAFLETSIRDTVNEFHTQAGVDLVAQNVTVASKVVVSGDSKIGEGNLRGRNLQVWYGPCRYPSHHPDVQAGLVHEGEWIEGCTYDVANYVTWECHLCTTDDDGPMWPTKQPTNRPTAPTRRPTNRPTHRPTKNKPKRTINPAAPTYSPIQLCGRKCTFDPTPAPTNKATTAPGPSHWNIISNILNWINNLLNQQSPTQAPTKAPSDSPTVANSAIPSMAPTVAPTEIPTKVPTSVPTKLPMLAPVPIPTLATTSKPTRTRTTIPRRTRKPKPTVGGRRPRNSKNPTTRSIDDRLLSKLKTSNLKRFRELEGVHFGV